MDNTQLDKKPVSRCSRNNGYCSSILLFLGRICLAAIFILSGIGKFLNTEDTAAYMASKGFSMVYFFLYAAAIVEILAGAMVMLGLKTRLGATILLLFLIPTTLIFHDFWRAGPAGMEIQMIMFLKNLAILGGLLYVIGSGPGAISIDRLRSCKQ